MGNRGHEARGVAILLAVAATGCAPHAVDRVQVFPSLRPVDTARPMVIFSQVQGSACGNDAVLGAIRDMKRLNEIDGYIEVVVHETGTRDRRCAQATAYPFRYGTSTATPVIRAGPETTEPIVLSGRTVSAGTAGDGGTPPASAPFNCSEQCQRWAALVETGSVKIALAKDRCEQRCKRPDLALQGCIAHAQDSSAAKACLTP